MKRAVNSWGELKKGDKFVVIYEMEDHDYPLNKELTYNGSTHLNSSGDCNNCCEEYKGNWLSYKAIMKVITCDLESLKKELDELEKEIQKIVIDFDNKIIETKEKITFCVANNLEFFDEQKFKADLIIKITSNSQTTREYKLEHISRLLNEPNK